MYLSQLRLDDFRLFHRLTLDLEPGWNVLEGPNGAGKTTVLEAAFLLSHGRSFRTSAKDALARFGEAGFSVFGRLVRADAGPRQVGVARAGGRIEARLDGETVVVSDLVRRVAVVCFEPGSHDLIAGSSEGRRRFLDWGVFHVEHDFLGVWRRYYRALKQRNAALRSLPSASVLDAWDRELAQALGPLTHMRRHYFDRLLAAVQPLLSELLGELGQALLRFDPGYDMEMPFEATLAASRSADLARGFTGRGAHRADWSVTFERASRREHLSRGQEKLCAFGMVMAQARVFADTDAAGEWPVICLDDVASEVDAAHQEKIISLVSSSNAQVLASSTVLPEALAGRPAIARFHVEPGTVTRLL